MSEIVLVNMSGPDREGLVASVMSILAQYDVEVLDIGEAVIHRTITFGVLIQITDREHRSPVVKDLLFRAHELGLSARFTPVSWEEYNRWVGRKGKSYYTISILGRRVTAAHLAEIAAVAAENRLNIDRITRLSRRGHPSELPRACVELSVSGEPADPAAIQGAFMEIARKTGVDVAFQKEGLYRRHRRLVVFDMDSTLIKQEVIDELAREAGVGDRVAAVTEAAMRGEMDFRESFRQRLGLLAGADASILERVAARLELTEGAERLFANLKALGLKTAILTGGFDHFARRLQECLEVDYVHANRLEVRDGRLTGRVVGEVIDGTRKAELLEEIAAREGIRLEQVIAVGDGANDLPMLQRAGLGIAFHAKPVVRESAGHSISTLGLDSILYLLGLRDHDALS
ncbi:MAG: phosphoserine phosphatase SerB [Deferrisomatales bacterium]